MANRDETLERSAQRMLELLNKVVSNTFRNVVWDETNKIEITWAQGQVLRFVARNRGCSMRELAQGLGVSFPAVTAAVDRLQRKGLLERHQHENDRRSFRLGTTAPGLKLIHNRDRLRAKGMTAILNRMSPQARDSVLQWLEIFVSESAKSNRKER